LLFAPILDRWWNLGGLWASIALKVQATSNPLNYKTPIYTQFAMIGISFIIFILLPESPWWLVSKGKLEKAEKVLSSKFKNVPGYDIPNELVSCK
jgi:MFS transporter, SP family, general alpha glucoside:H+ symporter